MTQLSPKQKRQARTRQAILDISRKIIAKEGVDALSMRRIAKAIDYSPAGLYEYFGSKEEIVHAVVEEGFTRFTRALASADESLEDAAYLRAVGREYVQFAVNNPEHFMLMFTNSPMLGPNEDCQQDGYLTDEFIAGMTREGSSFGIVYKAIDRGVQSGTFKLLPGQTVFELSMSAWSLTHGVAMLWLTQLQAYGYPVDRLLDHMQTIFIEGLKG